MVNISRRDLSEGDISVISRRDLGDLRYAEEVVLALPEELIRFLVRRIECACHSAAAPARRVSEGDARVFVRVGRLVIIMMIITGWGQAPGGDSATCSHQATHY